MNPNVQRDETIRREIDQALTFLDSRPSLHDRIMDQIKGEKKMKQRKPLALVIVLLLALGTVTAVAIELLTGTQIIEQMAVPLAQKNDTSTYRQESYTYEELVQLIQTLNENGITLDEDSKIMQAVMNGQGYWEEEVLMAICREAFGGNFSTWSIEEKYWFDQMTVQIGFKEKNPYRVPGAGDMSITEAKALAVRLLEAEYGVSLPAESDENWMLWEWFYNGWSDADGIHPSEWKFEYVNRRTNVEEYIVAFDQQGELLDISETGFHGEQTHFDSYDLAERYFSDKYGALSDWPLEAWAEFGQAIADFVPETPRQWGFIHAGYRLPPEGAISSDEAICIAMDEVALEGQTETMVICCTANDRPIYKVVLSIHFPGHETEVKYDAVWCLELDCMTGALLDKWEYTYGPNAKPLRMYVPFSMQESTPSFDKPAVTESPAEQAERERREKAYDEYSRQYGDNWFFWPLAAQRDALGGDHHVPGEGEMNREEVVALALKAITDKHGEEALARLGTYQVGAICCRYEESEGTRLLWEVYVTSDPAFMADGFRVNIVLTDTLAQPDVDVQRANAGNG